MGLADSSVEGFLQRTRDKVSAGFRVKRTLQTCCCQLCRMTAGWRVMTLASARGRNCHMPSVGKSPQYHEMFM